MSSDGTSVQERVFQMKGDFAGQRDFQSGQRFLDGSAPRLRRHAASCEAADGDLLSSSAGKDQKPSWGVGQSPTVLASAARRLSSFNQIQTNRNKQFGRGKHCGKYTVRGQAPNSPQTIFHRVNCKCWKCSYCGPRRAKRYKHAISATAEAMRLHRFLTLTLDPKRIEGDPVRYLNDAFAKLRVYLKRELHVAPQYIRVLEFQKNGNPHFHILIDQYIDLGWIRKAWVAVGGGFMVDIRCVDVHRVSRYLSKYLTKELLLSAPSRSRRVTTSRGITLLAQTPQKTIWTLVKVPIFRLFEVYARDVVTSSVDEDQLLESFTAILGATA
jgi:hypothetical protein